MASGCLHPNAGQRQRVVAYAWVVSPTVGTSIEAQVERIRRHCVEQEWEVASELVSRRFPELVELSRRVLETEAPRVVMTQEALADLERRFPEVWGEVRARLEARRVTIVPC